MNCLDSFLSYCRLSVSSPMFEAVGRAYSMLINPAMGILLEASGKNTRDSTRMVVQQYITQHNGGDAETAASASFIPIDDNGNQVRNPDGTPKVIRVVDLIEQAVLMFIQRYGWTGDPRRAQYDQSASDRYVAIHGGYLATTIAAYEPGVARILLNDMHALPMLCAPYYDEVCKAAKITRKLDDTEVDYAEIDVLREKILPTVVRHNARAYVIDRKGPEYSPFKNFPIMNSDFSVTNRDRSLTQLSYADLVNLCSQVDDTIDPVYGEAQDGKETVRSELPTFGDYDVYYIPNYKAMQDFCNGLKDQYGVSLSIPGFSLWHTNNSPWCLECVTHWITYVHSGNGGEYGSVYVLLKRGWNQLDLRGANGLNRLSEAGKVLDYSAIACVVNSDGTVRSACGRSDSSIASSTAELGRIIKRLLNVSDLKTALHWYGEDGERSMTHWVKVGEGAGPAQIAYRDYKKDIAKVNETLASGLAPSTIMVGEDTFRRAYSYDNEMGGLTLLEQCGHTCYLYEGSDHSTGEVLFMVVISDDDGRMRVLGGDTMKWMHDIVDISGSIKVCKAMFVHRGEAMFDATTMDITSSDQLVSKELCRIDSDDDDEPRKNCTVLKDRAGNSYKIYVSPEMDEALHNKNAELYSVASKSHEGDYIAVLLNDATGIKCVMAELCDGDYYELSDRSSALDVIYMTAGLMVIEDDENKYYVVTFSDGRMNGPYDYVRPVRNRRLDGAVIDAETNGQHTLYRRDGSIES